VVVVVVVAVVVVVSGWLVCGWVFVVLVVLLVCLGLYSDGLVAEMTNTLPVLEKMLSVFMKLKL